MSETKHTPGPWRSRDACVLATDPNCPSNFIGVADCRTVDVTRADAAANARLIAAAPALLEQCQVFRTLLQWQSVKDAIGYADLPIILGNLNAALALAEKGG